MTSEPAPPRPSLILHDDGLSRCAWPGRDAAYVAYHDLEWGVAERDSAALFEKLLLDGFQAGLSWISILRKRENFRRAFEDFDAEKIARFDERKCAELLADPGIIRNRAKIFGAVASAQIFLEIEAKQGFANFLWDFVDGAPIVNQFSSLSEVPASTPLSEKMSKALKQKGFKFCGPVICYAFMQAVGMVNDHLVGCWRHQACQQADLAARRAAPSDVQKS